jgi:hypothetical protein
MQPQFSAGRTPFSFFNYLSTVKQTSAFVRAEETQNTSTAASAER